MAKTKTPFFSMGAKGSVGGSVTAQKLASSTLLRGKPLPTDPYSLPQAYQRWLYEDYAYLWTKQSSATTAAYRSAGSRFHLTGFQYWMKYQLTNMPDIAAIWHLDARDHTIAHDSSPNANNGTVIGASPATGLIDGALYLDGVNDYIRVPNSPSLNPTTAMTFETFVRLSLINTLQAFMYKWEAPQVSYLLDVGVANLVRAVLSINTVVKVASSLNTLQLLTWQHIAFTYDGTNIQTYIDGLADGAPVNAPGTIDTSTTDLILGCQLPAFLRDLKGDLDHSILYNRACDPTEILRHSLRRYPPE